MKLENQLDLNRCPHCQVHHPQLSVVNSLETTAHSGGNGRLWRFYRCMTCGGVVTAAARKGEPSQEVIEYYPKPQAADETIPDPGRAFLDQAIESLHAPAGAIMLCASAVDAMLKEKNYKEESLFTRIDSAAANHLITKEMAAWAHEVRLEANDQRHVDETAGLPNQADAQKCIDFTKAFGEFLFVLPARIERGRKPTS